MIKVNKTALIAAPAEEVWESVRDFNGLPKFVSLIAESKMQVSGLGAVRSLTFADGHEAVETLKELDDELMTLRYSLENAPRPFRDYEATMHLARLDGDRCQLDWSSTFEASEGVSDEEARSLPEGLYEAGFEGLKKLHES